jgi:hypothetical protein
MNTIEKQARKIAQDHVHYNALLELGLPIQFSSLKELVRLERKAHRAAENYCNLPDYDYDKAELRIENRVKELFGGKLPEGFFINGDPRGAALKIESEFRPEGLHRDWGNYGILAPID